MKKFSQSYQKLAGLLARLQLGKVPGLKKLHRFLEINLRPKSVMAQGYRFFIDRRDFKVASHLINDGVHEPIETELIKKQVKPGEMVLDIGANIGYYTLILAGLVGPTGQVFAFEPDPDNFALLEKNVKANNFKNVILVNQAVADKNGQTKLYLSDRNKGDHRIYDSGDQRPSVLVDTIALNDFLRGYEDKIDFIKMDIQGAEGIALGGMANLIRNNQRVKILTEFWPMGLNNFNTDAEQFLKLLTDCGFRLYDVDKDGLIKTNPTELLEKYPVGETNDTNLFCVYENRL